MKVTDKQIKRMSELIFQELKQQNIVQFKADESKVLARASAIIKANFDQEKALDEEVHKMMDQLEGQHPGEFERYKMFPLLKKKLAKEKGFVL